MATQMVMPKLSYDMRDGTIVRWLKKEGEQVKRGEVIVEIETDKTVLEVEAYATGLLRRILVADGQSATVGQAIAWIGSADEPIPDISAPEGGAPATAARGTEPEDHPAAASDAPKAQPTAGVRASPLAKRLAQQKGIDLSRVKGSGPEGRITREDVENFGSAGT